MRIISKISDYYDSAMGQGQDRSIVYLREPRIWRRNAQDPSQDLKMAPTELAILGDYFKGETPKGFEIADFKAKGVSAVHLRFGFVLLAGRLHPYACMSRHLSQPDDRGMLCSDHYIYGQIEFEQALNAIGIKDMQQLDRSVRDYRPSWASNRTRKIDGFFRLKGSERWHAHCLTHHLVVLSWQHGGINDQVLSEDRSLVINPRLANLQFFRALNPFQAFQEIAMFVGNMAFPDVPQSKMDDRWRIQAHGFDAQSFRKRP